MNIFRNLLLFLPKLLLKLAIYIFFLAVKLSSLIIGLVSLLTGVVTRIVSIILFIGATALLVLALIGGKFGWSLTLNDSWLAILAVYVIASILLILPYVTEAIHDGAEVLSAILLDYAAFPLFTDGSAYTEYGETEDEDEEEEIDADEEEDEYADDEAEDNEPAPPAQSVGGFDPFAGVTNSAELKKRYFALAKCYHPDTSGADTNAQMEYINSEYQRLQQLFSRNGQ